MFQCLFTRTDDTMHGSRIKKAVATSWPFELDKVFEFHVVKFELKKFDNQFRNSVLKKKKKTFFVFFVVHMDEIYGELARKPVPNQPTYIIWARNLTPSPDCKVWPVGLTYLM